MGRFFCQIKEGFMNYLFTFLEGIASFISPCILPLLPVYISYFAGKDEKKVSKAVINSIGFVIGFSVVFILLGVFASTFGNFISNKIQYLKIIFGIIIILLGLNYMEIINIKILNYSSGINRKYDNLNLIKSILFGIIFSVSYTPCVGTFLSSSLLLITSENSFMQGIILMSLFSLGLGLPFIISAFLIEKMKNVFDIIKNNYKIIKIFSGVLLIFMGVYMIFFV